MSAVYGKHSMSSACEFEWNKQFQEGQMSLKDSSWPEQPHCVITSSIIAIRTDRLWSVEDIQLMLGISHGTAHAISTQHLKVRKISAQWVPHSLTKEQLNRMSTSLQHLEWYHDEEYRFLSCIVMGDETWCHHFEQESKHQSKQWKHMDSPPPKISTPCSRKVVMIFFFDYKGPLLIDFLEHGATINAQQYMETLQKLKHAFKSKHPGMLTDNIILLQDNAYPHVAKVVSTMLQKFRWEALTHPPYSPDLSPCDFHIFGALKNLWL
ncbi:histone-lysine N-methyltransferase SETMAR-like [Centruroides sculpturatus]|uniref:histone-lysine N-methyltransferase SETMAR-like n=1 Tax=Centruroides sculpturatus TaxID=218467 RepID=UPI000C6E7DA6|nr:histone-lysine N-methyltransferase SETMAR-like [Centruroides sculpturatus]